MTASLYTDTSAVVAYYVPEQHSAAIQAALQGHAPIAISDLVELEFFSALSLKVRIRAMEEMQAHRVGDLFSAHLDQGLYTRIHLHAGHYRRARKMIARFDLPLKAPDALHLATCLVEALPLLTIDDQMARIARVLGIAVEPI